MSFSLFLNSKDAQQHLITNTNYDVTWRLTLPTQDNTMNYGISLQQVIFENSVYPTNEFNNRFAFFYGGNNYSVTIPEGFYTGITMATILQSLLQAVEASFTVTYDSYNKKFTITRGGNFQLIDSTAMSDLGFISSQFNINATSWVSFTPIKISGSNYVDIAMDYSSQNFSTSTSRHIFARIPVGEEFGSQIVYEPTQPIPITTTQTMEYIRIALLDDRGNAFKLPANQELSVVLLITIL